MLNTARVSLSVRFISVAAALCGVVACNSELTPPAEVARPPATVAEVLLRTSTPAIEVNKQDTVHATLRDAARDALYGRAITWASSDTSVATVTSTNTPAAPAAIVTAISPGSAIISATAEGKSGTITLTVRLTQAFLRIATGELVALTGMSSWANAINDKEQVVGRFETGSGQHAFLWSRSQSMVDLGTLPGMTESSATAINNDGVVVGWSATSTLESPRAFRWTPATGMVDLGDLITTNDRCDVPSCVATAASGINSKGEIVGRSGYHPFVWTEGEGMKELQMPPDNYFGMATGINDTGQIAGLTFYGDGDDFSLGGGHAVLWTASGVRLVDDCKNGCYSAAWAINDDGQIVGTNQQSGHYDKFLWSDSLGTRILGSEATASSDLQGINDVGQMIGNGHDGLIPYQRPAIYWVPDDVFFQCITECSGFRGFLWSEAAGMLDIGVLPGKTSSFAKGINNKGEVVGYSW